MFDGVIDTITTRINDAFSGLVNGLLDYAFLAEWYVIVLAVIGVSLLITHFFQNTVVRGTFGVIVVAAISYLVGMTKMFLRMRRER